jgi:hypothetical protein
LAAAISTTRAARNTSGLDRSVFSGFGRRKTPSASPASNPPTTDKLAVPSSSNRARFNADIPNQTSTHVHLNSGFVRLSLVGHDTGARLPTIPKIAADALVVTTSGFSQRA